MVSLKMTNTSKIFLQFLKIFLMKKDLNSYFFSQVKKIFNN